jgi:hypothetical protein
VDAVETTLGWDTIYEPEHARVVSPVSRDWSAYWGGYVLFGWDTFFGATLAGLGDKDLAYANVIEGLHEETTEGFVPNYARAGGWKSSDRSEPPIGSITALCRQRVAVGNVDAHQTHVCKLQQVGLRIENHIVINWAAIPSPLCQLPRRGCRGICRPGP